MIAVWLGAGGAAEGANRLNAVRKAHPAAKLVLMTTPEGAAALASSADETWEDGAVRGASAFLARARRLSWASPAHIYDLEGSRATRFLRLCVWPRPQWHGRAPGKGGGASKPSLS